MISNERDQAIQVTLDNLGYSDKIKRRIRQEFSEVLELLDFETKGHDILEDGMLMEESIITK